MKSMVFFGFRTKIKNNNVSGLRGFSLLGSTVRECMTHDFISLRKEGMREKYGMFLIN